MDKFSYRVPPVPVSEEVQLEIIMVHGACGMGRRDEDSEYWYTVWEWLNERYPELFCAGEFPYDWHSDADHEKDMDVLTCIHTWQRHAAFAGRIGEA